MSIGRTAFEQGREIKKFDGTTLIDTKYQYIGVKIINIYASWHPQKIARQSK